MTRNFEINQKKLRFFQNFIEYAFVKKNVTTAKKYLFHAIPIITPIEISLMSEIAKTIPISILANTDERLLEYLCDSIIARDNIIVKAQLSGKPKEMKKAEEHMKSAVEAASALSNKMKDNINMTLYSDDLQKTDVNSQEDNELEFPTAPKI